MLAYLLPPEATWTQSSGSLRKTPSGVLHREAADGDDVLQQFDPLSLLKQHP